MDSIRNPISINVREKERITAGEVMSALGEVLGSFFAFILYIAEYAVSSVYRFFASEKASYLLGRYKKVVCGISALFAVFAAVGVIGGMEAGLVSLAVGAPVFLILCGAVKLLSGN